MNKSELKELITEMVREEIDIFENSVTEEKSQNMELEEAISILECKLIEEEIICNWYFNKPKSSFNENFDDNFVEELDDDEFDFDEWDFDFDDIEDTVKEIKDTESKKSYAEEISNKLSNNDNQEKAREKAAQKISSDINKKIGKNIFKTAGDRIVSVYSGKNGKAKQIAAIALTATAIAGSIGAIAVAINKKKQREESTRISGKK